ncbi:MAG: DUF1097 family protein [Solirubrobacteraceae bacterium]
MLAFIYVEITANFTFHWVTNGSLGNGLDLPSNFHLVIPAGFIAWGLFFALGADNAALRETATNCFFGCLAALVLFIFVDIVKGVPDFWAISLGVAILAFIIVLLSGAVTLINVPVIFGSFAACVLWWIATGLDGWAPNGGGVGNSVAALAKPATAGTGAFGGVLSTPFTFVALNVFVTLLIGCAFGAMSVRLATLLTPGDMKREQTAAADERVAAA